VGWLFGTPPAPKAPDAKKETPADARPEIGDVNVLEVCVGQRGAGKSTTQCMRADELSREWGGAYVIGHSLGGRLPTELPDGTVLPLVYHDTLAKLDKGLRRDPGKWHILAPPMAMPNREEADDLLQYSIRLSDSIKERAWKEVHPFGIYKANKSHKGIHATPIIVIIDEGIAIGAAGSTKKDQNRWFQEYLYSLRHMHIALFYSIQNANARSWHLLDQATAIHVFNTRHEWALGAIRAAGATQDEMDRIAELPTPKQLKEKTRTHDHVTLSLEGEIVKPDWAEDD